MPEIRVLAYSVVGGLTLQKACEGVARTASLPGATGVLTRYHPHIPDNGLSILEPANVS
jgi:hypothetical protein